MWAIYNIDWLCHSVKAKNVDDIIIAKCFYKKKVIK